MDAIETMLTKLLTELECSVCNEYMFGVIPMCTRGHSICYRCKQLCPLCPTCKIEFGNARNYALEKMLNALTFPCKYKANGCNMQGTAIEMQKHISECDEAFVSCLLDGPQKCTWRGKRQSLKEHFTSTHPKVNTNYLSVNLTTVTGFVFDSKLVFKICRKYCKDEYMQWVVQYIGHNSKAKDYMYKIEYKSDDGHEMTITADCVAMCNSEQVFNSTGITIQKKMFTYYKDINYAHKLTIIKKKE